MATIYAVVSPHSKIQIKTELLSPRSMAPGSTPQRPLRPVNKAGEPGKARRQLAMNLNKGGPVINNRRNARERNRVKQVNQGFAVLRAHLPAVEKSKKVSKVDTLRGAIDYIQGLSELLASTPARYEPPPYGYRADALCSSPAPCGIQQPFPGALPPPLEQSRFLPEPPTYQQTLRELRHHQHQQHQQQQQHQQHQHQHQQHQQQQLGGGTRAEEAELLGSLRWWPGSSTPPPPPPPLS